MIQEIIYTSAEKGLKQGSRGFCTVVSTAGMPINLAERLESMSGYRQVFQPGDPRSASNPVSFSHVTTRIAGQTLHVISRVGDAGQDYTGRSNKLAHHIVLASTAVAPAGPARTLAAPTVVVDRWNGEVKNVAPRQLPTVPVPTEVRLSAWKAHTGDHGWAGSIAEQLLGNPAPLNVVFALGTDTLLLVQEVLDLLPVGQRWNITFCTYFTRLLAGTECQLRFILDDTPEATAIRNDARARVVDLTKSLPAATGGGLVATARTGTATTERPHSESTAQNHTISNSSPTPQVSLPRTSVPPTLTTNEHPLRGEHRQLPIAFNLPPSPPQNRSGKRWLLVLFFAVLLGSLAIVLLLTRKSPKDADYASIPTAGKQSSSVKNAELEQAEKEKQRRLDSERKKKEDEQQNEANRLAAEKKAKEDQEKKEQIAKEEEEKKKKEEARIADEKRRALETAGPFAFLKAAIANEGQTDPKDRKWSDSRGQWMFKLPKPEKAAKSEKLSLRLNGQIPELRFFEDAKKIVPSGLPRLEIRSHDTVPTQWLLAVEQGTERRTLGVYTVVKLTPASERDPDAELDFAWSDDAARENVASEVARWLPIELQVGTRKVVLLQRDADRPNVSENTPSWATFSSGKLISQIFSDGLKYIRLAEISGLRHTIYFTDGGHPEHPEQVLQILKNVDSDPQDAPQPDPERRTITRYFPLSRPLTFSESEASVKGDNLLGFGILKLTVYNDLSVKADIKIKVRLPNEKTFLDNLPAAGIRQELEELQQKPHLFYQIAGNRQVAGWPDLEAKYEVRRDELMRSMKFFATNTDWWHEQKLSQEKLPDRKKDFTLQFSKVAKETMKIMDNQNSIIADEIRKTQSAINQHQRDGESVPTATGPFAGRRRNEFDGVWRAEYQRLEQYMNDLRASRAKWLSYKPAVDRFKTLINALVRESEEQITGLMGNYEKTQTEIGKWSGTSKTEEFGVRVAIESAPIAAADFENTKEVVIGFYHSNSLPLQTKSNGTMLPAR